MQGIAVLIFGAERRTELFLAFFFQWGPGLTAVTGRSLHLKIKNSSSFGWQRLTSPLLLHGGSMERKNIEHFSGRQGRKFDAKRNILPGSKSCRCLVS